jgi:hypothetical protein
LVIFGAAAVAVVASCYGINNHQGWVHTAEKAMRIILEGTSYNDVPAVIEKLRAEGIRTRGGGSAGDDGLVLVDDEYIKDALDVLMRSGIPAKTSI